MKVLKDRKKMWRAVVGFLIMAVALVLLGPVDAFTHGYYCKEADVTQIPQEQWGEQIDLGKGDFAMQFSPAQRHFAGFEINLKNQPENNRGTLSLTVTDEAGAYVDSMEADLGKVKEQTWYKLYGHKELKKGKVYTLTFSVSGEGVAPHLQTLPSEYLPTESRSGNVLLGYAYKAPVFTLQQKLLFCMLFLAAWMGSCVPLLDGKLKKAVSLMAVGLFLTAVLSWNYMYNSMDHYNSGFAGFQADSESLVANMLYAQRDGVDVLHGNQGFGLGGYDSEGHAVSPYKSQYGLQGKVFTLMARLAPNHLGIYTMNLLCSIAAAAVFVVIVMLIRAKYNRLMAGCFFVVFWLSPWIVNFGRNLYWVEFTWFLPMAIGLFCAWKIQDVRCRILSYLAAFFAILVKCLCGYEYVSTIMMGLVAFLIADLVAAVGQRDRERAALLVRTICVAGTVALAGFVAAICIHGALRGNGNLVEGMLDIFRRDVLRRTSGGDFNEFDPVYWGSFQASPWEVVRTYLHFGTEIITGIPGNLFPLLCIIPLCVFGYEYQRGRVDRELLAMYAFLFLMPVSWYCLGKSHSYIHTHMNYVLWYFGFVQICFYIPLRKMVTVYRRIAAGNREGNVH